jgi:uncharacterized protein (DUF1684 family)
MRHFCAVVFTTLVAFAPASQASQAQADEHYIRAIEAWRVTMEQNLRRDNGWLTLAGRYFMKPGENAIGTAQDNDVLLPSGLGPAHLGKVIVDGKMVELKLNDGITMRGKEGEFKGERVFATEGATRDWVSLGRMAFHIIERKGKFMMRLADNENPLRKDFSGRSWYGVKKEYKVKARFVPYPPGKTIPVVDILDEVHQTPSPGYLEFKLHGQTMRLDATGELHDKELFVVLKDKTAGSSTYGAGRFLAIEWPENVKRHGGRVTIDFNKAYNPPCAFSAFTTCPMPPKQNQLATRIEAGEKFQSKQLAMN